MLNFKVPEIVDKEWACECLSHVHSMNCEYTFGNLFLWRAAYKINIAKYDGFLICRWHVLIYIDCFKKITVRNDCQAIDFIKFAFAVYLKQKGL